MSKGYKYCKCGKDIPARSKICKHCDYEFKEGEKFERPREYTEEEMTQIKYCVKFHKQADQTLVLIPAGECPCKIRHYKNIEDWANSVIFEGKQQKKLYYITALKFFLRQQTTEKDYQKFLPLLEEAINA